MNTPEWPIPGLPGAGVGGAVVAVVGFAAVGWRAGRQAEHMAPGMAGRVLAVMVPVSAGRAQADPGRLPHLATIRATTGTGRRDALMATGWTALDRAAG